MVTISARERVLNIPMQYVLNDLKVDKGRNNAYYCPFHGERTASARITPRHNLLKCFGCEKVSNNIELVMTIKNMTYPDAVEYLLNLSNENILSKPKPRAEIKSSTDNFLSVLAKFKSYDLRKTRGTHRAVREHLEERKLLHAVEHLRANGYDIGTVDGHVTYMLNKFAIVRYPYNKANYGKPRFSYLCVNKQDSTLYICEGITDALALAEMGYNSIILHSVNNVQALLKRFKSSPKSRENSYIIATDNDNAGLKAKLELEKFFKANNYVFSDMKSLRLSTCKDIGDFYKCN